MAVPYYNIGTATLVVGSASMVGQGTLWQGNVRPGDVVYPRNGNPNIVANVVDNTHIDLLFPSNIVQTALPYAIMRTPDDVFTQTMAREVFQKITDSTLVALAGLPSAARRGFRLDANAIAETFSLTDKAKDFLGLADEAAMRGLLNVAPKQANIGDTTAGAGLTVGAFGWGGSQGMAIPGGNYNNATIPGIYNGAGPGAINPPLPGSNSIYGPLLVQRSSAGIVQIVTWGQSTTLAEMHVRGSADNGATWSNWRPMHIEDGSNANGRYLRFNDGTQICWSSGLSAPSPSSPAASIWGGNGAGTWTFPATFVSAPVVTAGLAGGLSSGSWASAGSNVGTTQAILYIWSYIQRTAANWTISAMAIGRWF